VKNVKNAEEGMQNVEVRMQAKIQKTEVRMQK
jgi:hypothetical protein